jgi:hypothetical protein
MSVFGRAPVVVAGEHLPSQQPDVCLACGHTRDLIDVVLPDKSTVKACRDPGACRSRAVVAGRWGVL